MRFGVMNFRVLLRSQLNVTANCPALGPASLLGEEDEPF